jgi:hypothetical protein
MRATHRQLQIQKASTRPPHLALPGRHNRLRGVVIGSLDQPQDAKWRSCAGGSHVPGASRPESSCTPSLSWLARLISDQLLRQIRPLLKRSKAEWLMHDVERC